MCGTYCPPCMTSSLRSRLCGGCWSSSPSGNAFHLVPLRNGGDGGRPPGTFYIPSALLFSLNECMQDKPSSRSSLPQR